MPQYQVMYWKTIPAQVKVFGPSGDLSAELPPRFQEVIDEVAMRLGMTDTDEYLDGWQWSDEQDRPGAAEDVLAGVLAELEAAAPPTREEMLRHYLKELS